MSLVECVCQRCGAMFHKPSWEVRRGKHKFCSRSCGRKARAVRSLEERFWEKVCKTSSGCWEWQAGCNGDGYAAINVLRDGKWVSEKAARVAWFLVHGEEPGDLHVLHTCDNKKCVNAEHHLYLGLDYHNSQDRTARGKARGGAKNPPRGEQHSRSILTEVKVREMRQVYDREKTPFRVLGPMFGVSPMVANRIVRRIDWSHVL